MANLLAQKRETAQRLKGELDYALSGGNVAEIGIAQTAYNNAASDLKQFEARLRALQEQLDCLADL